MGAETKEKNLTSGFGLFDPFLYVFIQLVDTTDFRKSLRDKVDFGLDILGSPKYRY